MSLRSISRLAAPSLRLRQLGTQFTGLRPTGIRRIQTSTGTMAPIPKTMKGVIIEKTGGIEVLEYRTDLPVPEPKDGEVLVKNDFIGINYIDTYFRSGLYPAPKPEILGREAEGSIVAVGSGELYNNKVGDRVVFLGTSGYAEYTATKAFQTTAVPPEIKPGIAAAAFLQGLTALTNIREARDIQKGDWVLVHAAAGGTGLWFVQLLHAFGARVIGTASTPEKMKLAEANGADFMINSSSEDIVSRVKEITSNALCSVVFDGVGKSTFDSNFDILARKGTLVSFGNASGPVPPFAIARLSAKNLKLMRPTLFQSIATREEFEMYSQELFGFITRGEINVKVHEIYPLSEVQRATADLEGRKTSGKLLLKP